MVRPARALAGLVTLAVALAGSTCKVLNEGHCANQDVPGNEFCRELDTATPFCSPCRREYHGCVDYEPFACQGYDNEIGDEPPDDEPSESSTTGAPPGSTGEPPASTSDASASDGGGTGSSDSGSSTDAGSSGTAGSSG
jgi:hypothetical protein